MAHIVNCIASHELGGSISKPSSPAPPTFSTTPPTTSSEKPFAWRMQQSDPQRKYQLFPREKQATTPNTSKGLDPEKAFAHAMNQNSEKTDRPPAGTNLRIRINQNNLVRRRKVSVPELGPMTTVQEVTMDSPTIPGRPPLHERSMSAPEDRSPRGALGQSSLRTMCDTEDNYVKVIDATLGPNDGKVTEQISSRHLAPLVIPESTPHSHFTAPRHNRTHLRSDSTPSAETFSRSARMEGSPMSRGKWTPCSSTPDLTNPRSASTEAMSASTLPTPVSAPVTESYRASPRPWEGCCIHSASSERAMTPDSLRIGAASAHRRGASESSGMMDRGRPRRRNEPRPSDNSPATLKPNDTSCVKSVERKAFEELPKGWKPSEAVDKMSAAEIESLKRQALGQVERFEILKMEDVETLSKELRHLDERTEYLRRTHTSLRAGRRNLHSRICQYLRSPRVARFSHESMLKQEEALAELDASIDDWVVKLEQADNRRTRVRQKLLEHVAAAATMLPTIGDSKAGLATIDNLAKPVTTSAQRSPAPQDMTTPPRSPTRPTFTPPSTHTVGNSPSPQRVVAQVPSTILEQPVIEEAAATASQGDGTSLGLDLSRATSTTTLRRSGVESIRIYAGDDVYALLADVEDQISRMSKHVTEASPVFSSDETVPAMPGKLELKDMERERQKSSEKLHGQDDAKTTALATTRNEASTGSSPSVSKEKVSSRATGEILLTSAVFKP